MRIQVAVVVILAGCSSSTGTAPQPDGSDEPVGDPIFGQTRGRVEVVEYASTFEAREYSYTNAVLRDGIDARVTEVDRIGSCRLLRYTGDGFCNPSCDSEHYCSQSNTCIAWPLPQFAGDIDIEGLSTGIVLRPGNDIFYEQEPRMLPLDLFDSEAVVTARSQGGAFPAFSLDAAGVPPLVFSFSGSDGTELELQDGADNTLSWSSPHAASRVRLVIRSRTRAHGIPPSHQLECDGPDTGSLTIPAELIASMPELSKPDVCAGFDCPVSTLERYTIDTAPAGEGIVGLIVAWRTDFLPILRKTN